MKAIAFDLGASSGKVMLANFDGEKLSTSIVHSFKNRQLNIQGNLYWNLLSIYQNLIIAIKKANHEMGRPINSIGIDSFSNDFGLIGRNGDIINQIRSYRDSRTIRHKKEIYEIMSKRELHLKTGNQNAFFNTLIQLVAMKLEGDGYLLENCDKLLLLPDLLGYMLTGEKYSEYTISSVTQMFDYSTNYWHDEIVKRFKINSKILAPIINPGTIIGELTDNIVNEFNVPKINVIAVAEHDTASAVVSLPTNKTKVAFISSGTWSLIGTELFEPIINEYTFKYNIAIEGSTDKRYRMIKNVMGLWLIQECQRNYEKLGENYDYADFTELASKERAFISFIDPDYEEFYMPGDILNKIRKYCKKTNQLIPETPGQFSRIILESLALKYRWVLEILEKIVGYTFNEIYILGGGGKNTLLNQFTADACGKEIYVGPIHASLIGNIIMQLRANKEISSLNEGREIVRQSSKIIKYIPQNTEQWNEQYEYFKKILML